MNDTLFIFSLVTISFLGLVFSLYSYKVTKSFEIEHKAIPFLDIIFILCILYGVFGSIFGFPQNGSRSILISVLSLIVCGVGFRAMTHWVERVQRKGDVCAKRAYREGSHNNDCSGTKNGI